MARLHREAPLNSVWEGTANMMCMDVRRAMLKDPRTIDALLAELRQAGGQDRRFDAMLRRTEQMVRDGVEDEFLARPMTEAVARCLQAAELLRHSAPEVADVFMATRGGDAGSAWGSHFGTLGRAASADAARHIVTRAAVAG
jgi:putative acyl-CoA dehydrogenase